jgi:FlaA1/EpsC-like NDP-sugar epimerase
VIRFVLHLLKISKYALFKNENRRIIIIGNQKEAERVEQLLQHTHINPEFLGIVGYDDQQKNDENTNFLGTFRQLKEIIRIYRIDEIIFCTGDISFQKVIDYMIDLRKYKVDYKIAPSEGIAIIGSNSIHTSGDLYTINLNTLGTIFKRFRNFGRKV